MTLHDVLGWILQGFVTTGMLILAAKMGLFPYVIFFHGKPPTDSTSKTA